MSLTCKSWDLIIMGGLEQASPTKSIFFFIIEVKTCWKVILTCCLKNWMQKDKDKWPPNHLSWKRQIHSMMKRSISCPNAPCASMAIGINWCPSWNLLYLQILTMTLNFTTTLGGQLMTFEASISYVWSPHWQCRCGPLKSCRNQFVMRILT